MNAASRSDQPSPTPDGFPVRFWRLTCRRRVGIVLLYMFAFGLVMVYTVPHLTDVVRYQTLLERLVSERLGMKVSIGQVRVDFFAGPGVTLSHVMALDKGRPVMSIKKITASLDLVKTLAGSLKLGELKLIDPTINLIRRRDGTFNLPFITPTGLSRAPKPADVVAATLSVFNAMNIINGRVEWTDRRVSATPVRGRLLNFQFHFARGAMPDAAVISTSGQIDDPKHPTHFSIRGVMERADGEGAPDSVRFTGRVHLDRLDMARFWPYLDPHVPLQKIDALASLDVKVRAGLDGRFSSSGTLVLSSIGIKYREVFSSELQPRDLVITHDVTGAQNSLTINNATLKIGAIEFRSKGTIDHLKTDNPRFHLSLESNKVDVTELKQYIPDNVLTAQQTAFVESNIESGAIHLTDFTFDGDLETLENLDKPEAYRSISGTLRLTDFRLLFDPLMRAFEGINGSFSLADNRLTFKGVKGRFGLSRLDDVSGTIERLHEWPLYDIHIKADLDLEEARRGIAAIFTSPELKEKFNQIDAMSGSIKLDLSATGDSRDPAGTSVIAGKLVFDNVGMESSQFGLPLVGLNGEIEMDLKDMRIGGLQWKAGSSIFILAGKIADVLTPKPRFDLYLVSKVNLEDIDRIRYIDLGAIYNGDGLITMETWLDGAFNDFRLTSRLDMTYAQFRFMRIIHKRAGFKNIYTFDGHVKGGENVVINRILVELGESRAEITGQVGRFLRGQDIDLTIRSDGARFDDMDQFLRSFEDIDSEGIARGSFTVKRASENDPVRLSGAVEFVNASFKIPTFHEPFRNCNGEFELFDDQIFLNRGEGTFGRGRFVMTGNVRLKPIAEFTMNVNTTSLALRDLFGPPASEIQGPPAPPPTVPLGPAAPVKRSFWDGLWTILISSGEGTISYIRYTSLDAKIVYSNKRYTIEPASLAAHGGLARGAVVIKRRPHWFDVESQFDIHDLDMNRYLKETASAEHVVSGTLNLHGSIKGRGKTWKQIKRSLEGEIVAKTGKGVIHRFNLLSKIFTLLNVSQYFRLRSPDLAAEGMPYDSITARFGVMSGVATTEDLFINSEAMRISAAGDYDIGLNRVDLKVGVMPFITIDNVVSSIPLIGHVLTNENGSLITSYYNVKGPIGDPDIDAEPLESLAASVIGIFQRIFELPAKAIEALKRSRTTP